MKAELFFDAQAGRRRAKQICRDLTARGPAEDPAQNSSSSPASVPGDSDLDKDRLVLLADLDQAQSLDPRARIRLINKLVLLADLDQAQSRLDGVYRERPEAA